jgi:hypothetical protein
LFLVVLPVLFRGWLQAQVSGQDVHYWDYDLQPAARYLPAGAALRSYFEPDVHYPDADCFD